jgi:hypothetical protein
MSSTSPSSATTEGPPPEATTTDLAAEAEDRADALDDIWIPADFDGAALLRRVASEIRRLTQELAEARALSGRWMKAALHATPVGDEARAFDPMNPEAWSEGVRAEIDKIMSLRSRLDAAERLTEDYKDDLADVWNELTGDLTDNDLDGTDIRELARQRMAECARLASENEALKADRTTAVNLLCTYRDHLPLYGASPEMAEADQEAIDEALSALASQEKP